MSRRRTDRFAYRHADVLAIDNRRKVDERGRVAAMRPLCITELRIQALAAYDRAEEGCDRAEAVRVMRLQRLMEVCGRHG
jgi:hypothetical protein